MLFGDIAPHIEYYAQGIFKDGNRSATDGHPYLQEAWIKFKYWQPAHVTIGQFKPAFGMERFTPDTEILTIDRSLATDHLVPDGYISDSFARDYGIQVDAWVAKKRLYYAIGAFGGSGANEHFLGNGPLLAGRLLAVLHQNAGDTRHPNRVALGGAFATRRDKQMDFTAALPGTAALGYKCFSGRDTRLNWEASADYGPASFRAEYFWARFSSNRKDLFSVSADGFYVELAYRFLRPVEAVAKYEGFNPDRNVVNRNDVRWTTIGLNGYIRESRIRLSADYVFKQEARAGIPNNAVQIQFQVFLH